MNARLLTANVRLVHFDVAAEPISSWTDHGAAHLVQPSPGCLVATEANNSLEPECVPTELLACYVPHRLEPSTKRLACALKDRTRGDRRLTMTRSAVHLLSRCEPRLTSTTRRTSKPFRPTQPKQELSTCSIRREPFVEFLERAWIVHAAGRSRLFVPHHNILDQLERSGYPLLYLIRPPPLIP